jgi:hypothetical protein
MLQLLKKNGIRLKLDKFQWDRLTLPLKLIGAELARPPSQNDFLHRHDPSPLHEPLFSDDAQLAITDGQLQS